MRKRVAVGLLTASLLLSGPLIARSAPSSSPAPKSAPVIATIVSTEGKVSVRAADATSWTGAQLGMNERARDHVKTAAESVAALEFVCGGRIGINPSTEVELVSPRSAIDVSSGTEVRLSSGSIWATLDAQKAPFKIVTPSATLGIRGTEFVVDETSGETELSVLSGEVEVTDATRAVTRVRPGQVLRARRGQRALLRAEGITGMRTRLQRRMMRLRRLLDRPQVDTPVPPAARGRRPPR